MRAEIKVEGHPAYRGGQRAYQVATSALVQEPYPPGGYNQSVRSRKMPERPEDTGSPEDMQQRLESIPLLWREHDLLREEMRILLRRQALAQG